MSGIGPAGVVTSDYWEKWPVTSPGDGSLSGREEGSR
jgi:hypothetical protein